MWRAPKRGSKSYGSRVYDARDYNHDGKDELGLSGGFNDSHDTSYDFWFTDGTAKNLAKFSGAELGAR